MAIEDLLRFTTSSFVKSWTLKNNDNPQELITGQFTATGYTENAGAKIPDVSTVNNEEPFPQWVGGEGETVNFTARIWQVHGGISIQDDVETLKRATKKDSELNRAPIYTFTWGTEIAFRCFVVSVGGIKYDEISESGEIKGATFSLVLRRLDNVTPEGVVNVGELVDEFIEIATNPSLLIDVIGGSPHKKSKTIKAKEGDTFESIAKQEYGNALLGDVLRRAQPEKVNLLPGDEVILIDDVEINTIAVTPQSVPMKANDEAKAVRQLKFEERNRTAFKVF